MFFYVPKIIKPLLFRFDPEGVHHFTFSAIKWMHYLPGVGALLRTLFRVQHPKLERQVFGLHFPNPVGLAAGFDKDAKLYKELSNFGFGFIEIGTVTPKPQGRNPKNACFDSKRIQHSSIGWVLTTKVYLLLQHDLKKTPLY